MAHIWNYTIEDGKKESSAGANISERLDSDCQISGYESSVSPDMG
jgi:hypothetical protein